MQLKTLLNRVHPVKGFVYEKDGSAADADANAPNGGRVEVTTLRAREGSKGLCSWCGRPAPAHDRLPPRRFDFVPLWGIAVVPVYAVRRADCRSCGGVKVERVPWCEPGGKGPTTTA